MERQENNLTNAVIEIDEVEYLITEESADKINKGAETISLKRLIDYEERLISLKTLLKIIKQGGIIDRLML